MQKTWLSIPLLLGMTSAVSADPISIDTSLGNGADTYIRLNLATNFGGAAETVVKNSGSSSTTRKGYLRFDVTDLGNGSSYLTGATLDFTTSTNNPGGSGTTPQTWTVNVYGLNDADPGENWDESTINWNNAPANGSNNEIGSNAKLLGQFTVPANATPDTVSFSSMSISNFLANDTDGNATFILQRVEGGSGNLAFATKESASAPVTLSGNAIASTRTDITTADGNGADSYVQLGSSTNFGGNTSVVIKDNGTGTTTRKGYVRFDLSGLSDDDLLGANVRLETSLNNQGSGGTTPQTFSVDVYGLNDGNAGENWDESSINFGNAPGNGSGNNLDNSMVSYLGSFTVPANAVPDEIDFASQELLDFLAADTNDLATLIFLRDGGSSGFNLGFNSKEGAGLAPTLSVFQRANVPEPASLFGWILGLGAVGVYVRRARFRRKSQVAETFGN